MFFLVGKITIFCCEERKLSGLYFLTKCSNRLGYNKTVTPDDFAVRRSCPYIAGRENM